MGRISKRNASLGKETGSQDVAEHKEKRYKAGIYARLSADQESRADGRTPKRESIEVQVEIAKKFVEESNRQKTGETIDIVECYTDLGKTGSNFEREGFKHLMQDIRLGEIDCVIVKDLSRFGRNYLEAGNYIEKIFPFLGVRFIAVSDGFDTGREGNENRQMSTAMAVEIKNLVNDMYAKDFSKKAKLHLKQRREEGFYVGGPPPYGYKAEWSGKRRMLVPDENTEGIVRFIYEKFVRTESYTAVADALNRRQINPPCIYKKTGDVYYPTKVHDASDGRNYKGWDKSSVERVLKSETYAGNLMQGKTSITARNEKNRIYKPVDEWVTTKNTHEPLVGEELYQKAAEIRQKIQTKSAAHEHPAKDYPIEENIFDRVLYCGVCGRKMTRSSQVRQYADGEKVRYDGYFCLNSGQTKVTICPESNRISQNELLDILLPFIRMEFAVFLDKPKYYMEYGKARIAETEKRAEAALKEKERKIRCAQEEESSVYVEYRTGKILQKDYVSFKMKQVGRLEELEKQKEAAEKEKKALDKRAAGYLAAIKALLKLKDGKEFTKDMVEAFIEKIHVYPGKRIEVLFTVTADCLEGVG